MLFVVGNYLDEAFLIFCIGFFMARMISRWYRVHHANPELNAIAKIALWIKGIKGYDVYSFSERQFGRFHQMHVELRGAEK